MKLNGKNNLLYLFLTLLISSHLLSFYVAKRTHNAKKITFRKLGEICYHSVVGWGDKNKDIECAKGLICRPPIKKNKTKAAKNLPFRCFKDNIKGKTRGNIEFASKKQRMQENSFLYRIKVPILHKKGREEEGLPKAGENDKCQDPNDRTFQARPCVEGFVCRRKNSQINMTGVPSYCMRLSIAGNEEVCFIEGYPETRRQCEHGLECKKLPDNGRVTINKNYYCVPNDTALRGEDCYRSTLGYKVRECETGYECKYKVQDQVSGAKGVAKYCIKKGEEEYVQPGGICKSPLSGKEFKCAQGHECKGKEFKGKVYNDIKTCNIEKVVGPDGVGEYEACSSQSGLQRYCKSGLSCRNPPKEVEQRLKLQNNITKICISDNIALPGEKCQHAVRGFLTKQCTEGYYCKSSQPGLSGAPSICSKKVSVANEGEECYQAIINYKRIKCANDSLECRVPDDQIGKGGAVHKCLKKKDKIYNEVVGVGQICNQITINYQAKKCDNGLECKPKENQLGTYYCQAKEENMEVAKAGEVCDRSVNVGFKRKKCPANYECKAISFKSGVDSTCQKITKEETVGYGVECLRPVLGYIPKKCAGELVCRTKPGETRKGVSSYCLEADKPDQNEEEDYGGLCAKSINDGFKPKKCKKGLVCRTREKETGVSSFCLYPLNGGNGSSSKIKIKINTTTDSSTSTTIRVGGKCSSGSYKSCESGHSCKFSIGSTSGNTYCLLPSAFDRPDYVPFVGVNNFCNETNKRCAAGSRCVRVYDNTKVCTPRI